MLWALLIGGVVVNPFTIPWFPVDSRRFFGMAKNPHESPWTLWGWGLPGDRYLGADSDLVGVH